MARPSYWLCANGDYWLARWREGGKGRAKVLGRRDQLSKRKATAALQEFIATCPSNVTGGSVTLAQYESIYFALADLATGTQVLHRQTFRLLIGHFGPTRQLASIKPEEAILWRAALATGKLAKLNKGGCKKPSESTVCRHIREAKRIFQVAVKPLQRIAENPFAGLKGTAPEPHRNWAYIDLATLDKLRDACPTADGARFLALCRLAGLRQGEALRLRWDDVDLASRTIKVQLPSVREDTKHRYREVPITPELASRLPKGEGLVCDGLPREYHLWQWFRGIALRAGVQPYERWCHTLRKNCESDWFAKYPPMDVCRWLGHSIAVAMRHYHKTTPAVWDFVTGRVKDRVQADPQPNDKPHDDNTLRA